MDQPFETVLVAVTPGDMSYLMLLEADLLAKEVGAETLLVPDGAELGDFLVSHDPLRTLLLIDADLHDSEWAGASQGRSGIWRLRQLNSEGVLPPVIVLNSQCDDGRTANRLNFIQTPRAVVDVRANLTENLQNAFYDLVEAIEETKQAPPASPEARAAKPESGIAGRPPTIEISIRPNECSFRVLNGSQESHSSRPMHIKPVLIEAIYQQSKRLRGLISSSSGAKKNLKLASTWYDEYKRIGDKANSLLMEAGLKGPFETAAGSFRQCDIRIRFNLDQDEQIYDCLWEAAFDVVSQKGRPIETPMARRPILFSGPKWRRDLMGNDLCLDILAIPARVEEGQLPIGPDHILYNHVVAALSGGLDALSGIDEEIDALRALERRASAKSRGPAVAVTVLECPDGSSQFEALKSAFEERRERGLGPFDVVHFAGHSLALEEESCLIFGGSPAEAIPVGVFADLVYENDVQMVYLSACRSNTAAIARELAGHDIPISIGFNWDLPDRKAVTFARMFYKALLKNDMSVCLAFAETRRRLGLEFQSKDPIWAAPVMMARPDRWSDIQALRLS